MPPTGAQGGLGGWQCPAIITEKSGAPINLGVSGTTAASIISNSATRPDVTGAISYPKTAGAWFNYGGVFGAGLR